MFNSEEKEIEKLRKLKNDLLQPILTEKIVYSDSFYRWFLFSLEKVSNIDKNEILSIFEKFKLSNPTSFEEYATLYNLSFNEEFMNNLNSIFWNSSILMNYILNSFMTNTIKYNIDKIIKWEIVFQNDFIKISIL